MLIKWLAGVAVSLAAVGLSLGLALSCSELVSLLLVRLK